jgi:hypothetical protein
MLARQQGGTRGLSGSGIGVREAPGFLGIVEVPLTIVMTAQLHEVVALAGGGELEEEVAERGGGFVGEAVGEQALRRRLIGVPRWPIATGRRADD